MHIFVVQHYCDSAPFSVNIKINKLNISDVQIPFALCPVPGDGISK